MRWWTHYRRSSAGWARGHRRQGSESVIQATASGRFQAAGRLAEHQRLTPVGGSWYVCWHG